jgi:hypothetical protein
MEHQTKSYKNNRNINYVNADIEVSFNSTAQKIDRSVGGMTASAGHTLKSAVTAGQSINIC